MGKAYEYLAEFYELTDILDLPENIRRQVLIQQVRPSVREAFYEIKENDRNLENLTEKLLQCDNHPEAYKNDYLEKIDSRRDHQIILMALLDVIDPCKPSKQADMRRKNSGRGQPQQRVDRAQGQQVNPTENKKFEIVKDRPQFRRNSNPNYGKNKSSVGNNPIPTNYSIMVESKEPIKENSKPLAWLENKVISSRKARAQAMFDNGSGMNVIHTDLVKQLGLKVLERPTECNTVGGITTLKYQTEEFKVRVKLRHEDSNKEKWYEFVTNGQVSDAIPNTLLLGVKFMDKYGIYRKCGANGKVGYYIVESSGIKHNTRSDGIVSNNPTENNCNDMYYIEVLTKFSERPSTPSEYTELPTTTVSSEEAKGIIYNPTENQVKVNLEEVWYAQENHMKKQPSPSSLEDLTTENEQLVEKYYSDLREAFNEDIAMQLPEHRPFDCKIELEPGAELTHGPYYPMNPEEEAELKEFLKENEEKGFIRRSESEAGYPVLYVPKKTGDKRLCTDYRKLNKITKRNSFPLPRIDQIFESMKGAKIYSKLDLKSAYNLVRIREGDEYKTAFNTKFGLFEYLVMPFGLTNAPATFQAFINHVLKDEINECCQVYLDDIIIYSKSLDEHIGHVRRVLQRLIDNKLVAKLSKCEFHKKELIFLGHIVSVDGVKTDPAKLEAITKWPIPTKVRELQSFLGFCNYYRKFINRFADIARPLYALTSNKIKFAWNKEAEDAFNKLKEAMVSPPVLRYPDHDKQFVVECDASNYAIGGVLSQQDENGELHPVYYYSKKLNKAEINYSITEKELLSIKTAFVEWRHLLMGAKHKVLVYTDHRNLLYATKPQLLSARQASVKLGVWIKDY